MRIRAGLVRRALLVSRFGTSTDPLSPTGAHTEGASRSDQSLLEYSANCWAWEPTISVMNQQTNEMGVPPALPGRQSNFENSGSIPPAVAFVFAEARCLASLVPLQLLLLFTGCDQAPLRGQQP